MSCNQATESVRMAPEIGKFASDLPEGSLTLPDPWLFDSEALLRELDRCRETALQIPTNGDCNATHFGIQATVNALWTLRENLRYLLRLHKDMQRSFRKRDTKGTEEQHQTIYVGCNPLLTRCLQHIL